ncbi:MAG: efflux transporter periplasmic adaptor subunit [Verrucomicrobia bacterium]|nr:MAG: efflux transporter periplasmic adaptor subunit [Verrucomicrobiota bacterium]PYL38238.1 MAG: efflux transporter periplasmic adaptor subunit [Verrucomicrobiota bacterium]PYL57422.1 MAG: efflux transporter periplasmic adaptor subunit [Verrucomicrobiota bacterium]
MKKLRVKSTRKALSKAVLGLVVVLLVIVGIKALQILKMKSAPMMMPPTTVSSAPVKEEDWSPMLSSVGSISAVQGAVVSTELGGTVAEIKFPNGSVAKQGDVLVKLDASSEEAQLRTAEADLELARADLQRSQDLATRKVISKAELDSAESKFKQKQGTVDNMRAMIVKKEVRAPFAGQLGIRQVNVGQMINAGQQVVSLQALDPVYVDFALPQQHLANLSQGLEVHVQTDALPGREFVGKLTALNSSVDPVTRNVGLQATLENRDHALRPGMFAKIDVVLPEKEKTLVVPGSAVSYAPYGDSVFVIEKKKEPKTGKESQMIRQQFVRVGEARGDFISITQGLEPGQTIVSTGVFKLRNGMPVVINNDLAPKPQLNPKPADT